MNKKKVGIVGGGAAGLMAAITAAREGAAVTLLEAGERVGKKLLSTGNGKCNLSNLDFNAGCYYGPSDFLEQCFSLFDVQDTISFFEGLGLFLRDRNGYLYPFCEQASAVLDVLRHEIASLGIQVETMFRVDSVKPIQGGDWEVRSGKESRRFDAVILTTGGKAAPKTGSDGSGYDLAKALGHRIVPVVPALTALRCKEDFFPSIAGVRTDAEITLFSKDGAITASERGELQLTDYGISGIPTFQLSRIASYALKDQKELKVKIDFLPQIQADDVTKLAKERMALRGGRSVEELFTGTLHKKLVILLIKRLGLKPSEASDQISESKLIEFFWLCKNFTVTATKTGDFQNCQVCAGGVDLQQIKDTMESKLHQGLFFAGELLDVDGRCGGYNLQWAWTSGWIAGKYAAGMAERRG